MHARQASMLATLQSVQEFLDEKKAEVAPVNESGARKALDELVARWKTQAIDQVAGADVGKGLTAQQAKLRATLRDAHMKPIAAAARARLRNVPEMHAFKLPPANTPTTRLVAIAAGMADVATKYATVFVDAGLPADFIAQLNQSAEAVSASLVGRTTSLGRSVGATVALNALMKQGANALHVLDALVRPKLADDDRLLGEWRRVKAIHKKTGPARETTAPAGTTTTPTTTPNTNTATTTTAPKAAA